MTAEEKALKEYPPKMKKIWGPFEGANEPSIVDDNLKYRIGYVKGYEQAIEDFRVELDKLYDKYEGHPLIEGGLLDGFEWIINDYYEEHGSNR